MDTIINSYLDGTINLKEKEILEVWVSENAKNRAYFEAKIRKFAQENPELDFNSDEAFKKFVLITKRHKKPTVNKLILYAAAVLVLIGLALFYKLNNFGNEIQNGIVNTQELIEEEGHITISLSDGTKQVLVKSESSVITDKSGKVIGTTKNGAIVFGGSDEKIGYENPDYSEIFIPYGEKFVIQLTDGTKVWLNSGSRLRFAQNLNRTSGERLVFLDGEAFFDVAKDKSRPFIVKTGDLDIQVLGTKFNVSGYKMDRQISTTLVEGSVRVMNTQKNRNQIELKPSYQATFKRDDGNLSKNLVDTDLFTAWMSDRLVVNGLTFSEILEKLERSYNVTISNSAINLQNQVYKGEFQNEDLETILKTISISTPFNYNIKGNQVTITN